MPDREASESGVLVYPRVPVPKGGNRDSAPKVPKKKDGPVIDKMRIVLGAAGLAIGVIIGLLLRPVVAPDGRVDELVAQVDSAAKAAQAQRDRADAAEKSLEVAQKARDAAAKDLANAEAAQVELATKVAEGNAKAKEAEEQKKKLLASVENGMGSVSSVGDEIHLQLVDKVLFKLNDDQLTEKGKQVIDKVASALKEIPDKQIWVQGHTDDQPIFNVAPKAAPVKKGQKPPAVIPPRFATNWELSAARALTVVHYLQDTAKIDPSRLAALAFGQYRPVSRSNKALNRRIEIVLVPKKAVLEKDAK
jgi:chemotaxis protein MotB